MIYKNFTYPLHTIVVYFTNDKDSIIVSHCYQGANHPTPYDYIPVTAQHNARKRCTELQTHGFRPFMVFGSDSQYGTKYRLHHGSFTSADYVGKFIFHERVYSDDRREFITPNNK